MICQSENEQTPSLKVINASSIQKLYQKQSVGLKIGQTDVVFIFRLLKNRGGGPRVAQIKYLYARSNPIPGKRQLIKSGLSPGTFKDRAFRVQRFNRATSPLTSDKMFSQRMREKY